MSDFCPFTPYVLGQGLTEPRVRHLIQISKPPGSVCFQLVLLEHTAPGIYVSAGDQNSAPHDWAASPLPTELSPSSPTRYRVGCLEVTDDHHIMAELNFKSVKGVELPIICYRV